MVLIYKEPPVFICGVAVILPGIIIPIIVIPVVIVIVIIVLIIVVPVEFLFFRVSVFRNIILIEEVFFRKR